MRKLWLAMVMISLLVGASGALAEEVDLVVCQLAEIGLQVPVPADFYVITRDVDNDDPLLAEMGWDALEWREAMETGYLYMDAVSRADGRELTVVAMPKVVEDFADLTEDELVDVAANIALTVEDSGWGVVRTELLTVDDIHYVFITESDGGEVAQLEAYTFHGGMALILQLSAGDAPLGDADDALFQRILAGVRFGGEGYLVENPEVALSFVVPDDWEGFDVELPDGYDGIAFGPDEVDGCSFLVVVRDLWDPELEALYELLQMDRAMMDLSLFTPAEMASSLGVSEKVIEMVRYGGENLYQTITNMTGDDGVPMLRKTLVTVENGYMYYFYCDQVYSPDDPHGEQFAALLDSLVIGW